jgi:hypothetical protein
MPYKQGKYEMVAAGFFLLMTSLAQSTYRINFGGISGAYHTESVYDITIVGKRRKTLNDTSKNHVIFKKPWK